MEKKDLKEYSLEFAVEALAFAEKIKINTIKVQFEKSATSIGANIHEATYAQSRSDFISKMQIALKECSETEYWLKLLDRIEHEHQSEIAELRIKSGTLRRKMIASITTAKENT